MKRPDYGFDAPGTVCNLLIAGIAALLLLLPAPFGFWPGQPWGALLACLLLLCAADFLGLGFLVLHASRTGKLSQRERLLDLIPWSGREHVLDVGCGHGLMLVGAAKRLSTGKAIGIDLWHSEDQADNRPDAPLSNARLENVADRVEVQTADMRHLPFPDESFDVVLSHWVVHNLHDAKDRSQALAEMARVLKRGGYIVLADIEHHAEYAVRLASLGLSDIRHVGISWETALMASISLGRFRPTAVVARKEQT
ncbi:MAG: class I SAM-dependent methyltransferase [Thermoguttaceae bacterium]